MRKTLTRALYLGFVELLSYLLVVIPAYSFQVSSSTTGYVRIASQAAMASMVSAQRAATLASVAPLISGASAGSIAVRLVAGSVGWPALGIVAGLTLAMLYYDSTKVAAIKSAAAIPGVWTIPGVSLPKPLRNSFVSSGVEYVILCNSGQAGDCDAYGPGFGMLTSAGYACVISISNTNPPTSGTYLACTKGATASAPHAVQGASTPATPTQIATYIGSLPSADPNSVESNTVPVGSQVVPTPADSTASNPIPDTGLATTVVPATSVGPTDLVVNPNATPPAGTETTKEKSQPTTGTSTTTTTTTTNPDGSVTTSQTKTDTDTASVSCAAGNHEQRTFGSILQDHMNVWQGSGLLSALNLLKTLTWPSTPPTYSLTSSMFGSYTIDFSVWSGMLTAIRSLIIALAGFVAYRIVFVGSK
jgi:hypothetical protein